MRRQKVVVLVVLIALLSSIGLYVTHDSGQNPSPQKEDYQAIFYEQGLSSGEYWSVTIHPFGSPSNITTLSTNSTEITFGNLRTGTYNYSFSQINGEMILSYGGKNTSSGIIGNESGMIWVGTKIVPTNPDGKVTTVSTVYTLGVYSPRNLSQ